MNSSEGDGRTGGGETVCAVSRRRSRHSSPFCYVTFPVCAKPNPFVNCSFICPDIIWSKSHYTWCPPHGVLRDFLETSDAVSWRPARRWGQSAGANSAEETQLEEARREQKKSVRRHCLVLIIMLGAELAVYPGYWITGWTILYFHQLNSKTQF